MALVTTNDNVDVDFDEVIEALLPYSNELMELMLGEETISTEHVVGIIDGIYKAGKEAGRQESKDG